jgi:protein-S-isoprenylcysteine O-methyltransferase Ste14
VNQRSLNLFSSLFLLSFTYVFYWLTPYYQRFFSGELHLFSFRWISWDILQIAFLAYAICLTLYYLIENSPRQSKSALCLRAFKKLLTIAIYRKKIIDLTAEEKLGLLSFLLKAFFAPLMVVWLFDHTVKMLSNGFSLLGQFSLLTTDFLTVFNSVGFWFLLQVILFLDVFFFTLGYLIELPSLKNTIRSVDSTLLGWIAALACYPPFNLITSQVLGWEPVDFPQFDNEYVHIFVNSLLLILMAIYTSASVALNFKASNLTHRGIICCGPYRVIRHPAYICKNLAWWLAAIPALTHGIEASDGWAITLTLVSASGWTLIYMLRALTEEDHLKRVDQKYDEYCQKVRYRFFPGIY